MHTISIFVDKNRMPKPASYFECQTHLAKNLRNAANFIIRNLRTGLKKAPDTRNANENEVLETVRIGIEMANEKLLKDVDRLTKQLHKLPADDPARTKIQKRIENKQKNHPSMPTSDHWMLTYETLDAVMKNTKNPDYYAMPSQVNQQVLRKVLKDWKSYFEALTAYRQNPERFKSQPKQPGYIKTPYTTVTFTNQVAKRSDIRGKMYITFPRCPVPVCVGKSEGSYVRTEVKPCYGGYMIYVTFQDTVKTPEAPKNPTRILGRDPGLDNFLTALTNFPEAPFILDGHWLKSINQNFNRKRAVLMSELTRGLDSTKSVKNSARLNRISKNRACQIEDFFYKAAHYIVDFCLKNMVEVIVCGHNKDQKQGINIGASNNQHFVSIPYARFFWILTCVTAKAGIPVIETEESFTSRASLIDNDPLPVYKEGKDAAYRFSGKRISRGQYESKNGTILNADVNGAGNIIRKIYPNAFDEVKDFSYTNKTVIRVTREVLCLVKHKEKHAGPRRKSGMNRWLHHRRQEQKLVYFELFKASSARDKTRYIEESKQKAAQKTA